MSTDTLFSVADASAVEADAEPLSGGRERVAVLVPLAVGRPYVYGVPEGVVLAPGDFVRVPLGSRTRIGVVWEASADALGEEVSAAKLRLVSEVLVAPPMPEGLRRFVDWVAAYNMQPLGAVLRLALSVPAAVESPASAGMAEASAVFVPRGTPLSAEQQAAASMVLSALAECGGVSMWGVESPTPPLHLPARSPSAQCDSRRADGRALSLRGDFACGGQSPPHPPCFWPAHPPFLLRPLATGVPKDAPSSQGDARPPFLAADSGGEDVEGRVSVEGLLSMSSEAQKPVVGGMWETRAEFAPPEGDAKKLPLRQAAPLRQAVQGVLLDGVTGSGKTEVYFEAVAATVEAGKQVLVLLPEIALTEQFLQRFQNRFGCAPMVWHSSVSRARRRDAWRQVARGDARVVVGARSALFLPFAELGLIVVDEEHEQAFKQEDGVPYHARDMAIARAWLEGFPILLSSATPSLETLANVKRGRFAHVKLPRRYGGAAQPRIERLDLRKDAPSGGRWLSDSLVKAMAETLGQGDQALLFLNRRGYAPVSLCRACGERITCPHCDVWLVAHRASAGDGGRLLCHHCGYRQAWSPACASCGEEGALVSCGPGVERIAEEAKGLFPQARVETLSSDAGGGRKAEKYRQAIARIAAREVDIIVGTQIVAKGHHFPHLTLVGVVDADLGLANGDLRAAERSYQLLHQVIGRCGRAERPGVALLQTWMPGHPVMSALAAGERDAFMECERRMRYRSGLPPFGRLAAVILSAATEERGKAAADMLAKSAPRGKGFSVLGPAPAPLYRLRGKYRWRFLVRAKREIRLQEVLAGWLNPLKLPGGTRLVVDVDPYHFG